MRDEMALFYIMFFPLPSPAPLVMRFALHGVINFSGILDEWVPGQGGSK